jgi:nucleotide-binding universal stress UspA family protein
MFEKIIVTLDSSKIAEMVLPYVEEIAGKFNSSVNLVGVAGEKTDEALSSEGRILSDEFQSYLTGITNHLKEEGKEYGITDSGRITSNILYGHTAPSILSFCQETNSDLVALTSKGKSSHRNWVLGSVAAKILRAAKKPVLLVRRNAPEAYLKEKRLIRKILLPLDGSKLGETAIPYAEALAQKLSAEITLMQVVEPFDFGRFYDLPHKEMIEEEFNKGVMLERTYLNSKAEAVTDKTGVKTNIAILKGNPAQMIAKYAEEHQIDLIAMSTHGRTGVMQWVFGSVTDKTLHFGETAVLVVRPEGKK